MNPPHLRQVLRILAHDDNRCQAGSERAKRSSAALQVDRTYLPLPPRPRFSGGSPGGSPPRSSFNWRKVAYNGGFRQTRMLGCTRLPSRPIRKRHLSVIRRTPRPLSHREGYVPSFLLPRENNPPFPLSLGEKQPYISLSLSRNSPPFPLPWGEGQGEGKSLRHPHPPLPHRGGGRFKVYPPSRGRDDGGSKYSPVEGEGDHYSFSLWDTPFPSPFGPPFPSPLGRGSG